jgi:hypothetical protein
MDHGRAEPMSDVLNAKGAAAYLKAGLGARKMAYSHLAIGGILLFLSIGGIYRYMGRNHAIVSLGLTVMAIGSVILHGWAEAMGDKADKFTDRAIDWKQGTAAEEGVGGLLGALPNKYFVIDGFVTRKGTVDYILVGPKGILTIGTKSDKGVVTSDGEKLLSNGHPFERDLIKQAWAQSYLVRDLLAANGVCTLRPQPVIVFTEADVQVKGRVGRVQVVGIKDLQAFLEGLPVWISDRLSKGIIDCLLSTQSQ